MPEVKVHNKLIRNNVPDIIRKDGAKVVYRTLKRKEFIKELKKKIVEKAQELVEAKKKKEIIDKLIEIYELVSVLRREMDVREQQFKLLQIQKKKLRGGFDKRLFLIETEK